MSGTQRRSETWTLLKKSPAISYGWIWRSSGVWWRRYAPLKLWEMSYARPASSMAAGLHFQDPLKLIANSWHNDVPRWNCHVILDTLSQQYISGTRTALLQWNKQLCVSIWWWMWLIWMGDIVHPLGLWRTKGMSQDYKQARSWCVQHRCFIEDGRVLNRELCGGLPFSNVKFYLFGHCYC